MDADFNENGFGNWSRASEDVLRHRYPVHRACRDGDIDALSLLIVSGQQNLVQEDEFYGWSPAHWAAYFGQVACLRKVMQALASEPSSSRYHQTPAHLAAFAGHPHCLTWLSHTGADLNKKDYMGETPVHKAARTGSIECICLMAAMHADLRCTNNAGFMPSSLAAKCGYIDCALYLQKAAEQQQLRHNGIIEDMMLPVIPTQPVLPGQKPNCCVIAQGINGGRLPNSIDSQATALDGFSNGLMEVEMEQPSNNNRPELCANGIPNGHTNHTTNGHSWSNGVNGSQNGNSDILLSERVAKNITAIGGRKRGREEIDDEPWDDLKRMCRSQCNGVTDSCSKNGSLQFFKSSSSEEHSSTVIAQQGYDSMFIDNMLLEYHGI